MATLGIEHIGITMPGIDATTAFFEQAFGARLVYEGLRRSDPPIGGPDLQHSPGAAMRAARLIRLADGPNLETFGMAADDQRPPPRPSDFDLHHSAVFTGDIDAAAAQPEAAGGTLLEPPAPSLLPLEHAPDFRFCYGRTPWGQIVEMTTYTHAPYERETPLRRWHPPLPAAASSAQPMEG